MSATAEANLASLLTRTAAATPGAPAVVLGGAATSYRELEAAAAAAAAALADAGVGPGDRVGILLPNGPAWIAAYYGTLRLGAVAVPLNVLLRDGEVAERVEDAEATVVVAAEGRGTGGAPRLDPLVLSEHERGSGPALAAVEPTDTAVLLYTSGTTGRAKGAQLTHDGLASVARVLGRLLDVSPDDVVLGVAPFAHVFGMSAALNMTIACGASVALLERFEAHAALDLVERDRVSVFLGVPTMCHALLGAARETGRTPAIRIAHCGGAPLPVATLHDFAGTFRCTVLEGYGLTETAGTVTSHRAGRPVKPGTVGEPIPGVEVRLEAGEVLVRGPGVMRGYWRNEAETRAVLSDDGWLATGDVGELDEDGYLTLVDRKKDVIIRGGYNVYPREVEEALYAHPAVREAVVVGVPDEALGEEVAALVVPREQVSPDELKAFVRERVAAYKYPRLVVLVDALPVGPTGKVQRREIDREALSQLLGDAAG